MSFNVLCIGDVVGRPGRQSVSQHLPRLKRQYDLHCVVTNVENAAGGSGLTNALFQKFRRYGVDVMTLGDHAYRRKDILPVMDQTDRLVRPGNLPGGAVGRDHTVVDLGNGHRVAVLALLGRLYMPPHADNPFTVVDDILKRLPSDLSAIIVDMHAEATSEKVAMGWHLDGRATVVFGTHTHVPTADECILPRGTAYITDVGMTGPHDSVLGRVKQNVLLSLTTSVPHPYDVADGDPRLSAILVRVDTDSRRALHIERMRIDGVDLAPATPQPPPADSL
jgi:metallophosphoesterase (TIGR00282 family)